MRKKDKLGISQDLLKDVHKELHLINKSLQKSRKQINEIKDISIKRIGEENAAVFVAHIQILEDPAILNEIKNILGGEKKKGGEINDKIFSNIFKNFYSKGDPDF